MKRSVLKSILGFLLGLPLIVAAEGPPSYINVEISNGTWYALGALVSVLILIFIYWVLQSKYKL